MRVAIVGGTGAFGRALAKRLHEIGKDEVLVGSRDAERAQATAEELGVTGGPNADIVAGADCLYAPGIRTNAEIVAVVQAVAPKPVNVLVSGDFTTVTELAAIGVRRISVGGALARAAWTGFLQAAEEIAQRGSFTALARGVPFDEINESFDGWLAAR